MVATSEAMARFRSLSLLTAAAMVAFAANSVLCRAALGGGKIDAASFSAIRLLSGALALLAIHAVRRGVRPPRRASWFSAALLFLYAVPFSFAYNTLTTGTGALILFAAVQATMLVAGLAAGERPLPLAACSWPWPGSPGGCTRFTAAALWTRWEKPATTSFAAFRWSRWSAC